jgi:hypothetical protein
VQGSRYDAMGKVQVVGQVKLLPAPYLLPASSCQDMSLLVRLTDHANKATIKISPSDRLSIMGTIVNGRAGRGSDHGHKLW